MAEERDRKEEEQWHQIEAMRRRKASPGGDGVKPTDALWRKVEAPSYGHDNNNVTSTMSFGTGTYGYKQEYDLEQAEREIIANLEREEKANSAVPPWRDAPTEKARNGGLKPWKSSGQLSSGGFGMNEVEARTIRDMESTLEGRPVEEKTIKSSMRFFDFEADQKRMEEWSKENDRRNKVSLNFLLF